jgi:NhaP-type Na+/H+ or K+/H+ antiporter
MSTRWFQTGSKLGLAIVAFLLTSCGRAPSFDILGSLFPAWLVCLALGLLLTVAARWLLSRLHIVIALPVLTYPSLTVLFTFALWLAFFR